LQTFNYSTLPPQTVRLVEVHPDELHGPVVCSISQYNLDVLPEFDAVSYAWNTRGGFATISCGDGNLIVQQTVLELMERVRRPNETSKLWIDEICINQDDILERNAQVSLMDQIYLNAKKVVIWLGEEDERTDRLDQLFVRLETAFFRPEDRSEDIPWRLGREWTDLAYFLDRPWFTRTWVLQEVCLAEDAVFQCGKYSWPFRRIQDILDKLLESPSLDATGIGSRLRRGATMFMHRWGLWSPGLSISELLISSRGSMSSLAVDKVYAILNLVRDPLSINVDYGRSPQSLYTEVAARIIEADDLNIITHASDNVWNSIKGLPSWVPDWTSHDRPVPLPSRVQTVINRRQPSGTGDVSDSAAFSPYVNISDGLLTLDAIQIDIVHKTGVPWPGNQHIGSPVIPDLDIWEIATLGYSRLRSWHSMLWNPRKRARNCSYRHSTTGESKTAAFMRTIMASSVPLPSGCTDWDEVHDLFMRRLWRLRREGAVRVYSEMLNKDDPLKDYHEAVRSMCYKRTLFTTRNAYIGLGPFFTLPTDRIVTIPGVNSLLVVRRTLLTGRYKLVGECYLHAVESHHQLQWGEQKAERMTLE
jgi:hypothetical protein